MPKKGSKKGERDERTGREEEEEEKGRRAHLHHPMMDVVCSFKRHPSR